MHGYDAELVHALYNGFKFGFPIHFHRPRVFYAKNLVSAYEHPQIVFLPNIFMELGADRLAGPFGSQENTWRISHDTPLFLPGWVFD